MHHLATPGVRCAVPHPPIACCEYASALCLTHVVSPLNCVSQGDIQHATYSVHPIRIPLAIVFVAFTNSSRCRGTGCALSFLSRREEQRERFQGGDRKAEASILESRDPRETHGGPS